MPPAAVRLGDRGPGAVDQRSPARTLRREAGAAPVEVDGIDLRAASVEDRLERGGERHGDVSRRRRVGRSVDALPRPGHRPSLVAVEPRDVASGGRRRDRAQIGAAGPSLRVDGDRRGPRRRRRIVQCIALVDPCGFSSHLQRW
ncbi:MAG: hypothetical protein AVDCRST_MAG79-1659 [uncultured Thermoleophilia bacterium]|uniref:Uncharacterized protein n=1 Tax=uncultured Thermoleophilia bacterium TaxID=1497501 RepID=A0A6J4U5P6_9ACTN|nr:MAG: hypothetical protein AVDCRST_MAG79-1659 [uncultured Thermoleophilia bacterium]